MSTKDVGSSSRAGFEWLYPDLLSKEELVNTLEQRYIKGSDLQKLEKDGLVELYNKYIIPLPQRKYRHNRRGRDMTVKQIKLTKKRRAAIAAPDDSQPPEKRKSTGKLMTSFDMQPTVGDRLKPPPSCIDTSKKKIKLGSSSSSSTSSSEIVQPVSSSLNKLKLTKIESPAAGKDTEASKKIRLKNNVKVGSGDTKVTASIDGEENGKKPMKESSDEVEKTKDPEPMDTSNSGSEKEASVQKKIKLTRISWP